MMSDTGAERILKRMYHRSIRLSYAGTMIVMINSVIDGMIISHYLGGRAAAAFGLVMPFYSLMNLIPVLLRYSVHTRIGECLGRGDTKEAGQSLSVLIAAGIIASVPLILSLTVFRTGTLSLLTAGAAHSDGIISMASEYMRFLSAAIIPIMLCSVLHSVMQLDGDIKRSPRAILISAAANIACDLANVLIFHGGMAGMAIATDISCFAEFIILLMHYTNKNCVLRPAVIVDRSRLSISALFSGGLSFMFREMTAFISGILLNRMAFSLAGETGVSVLCIGNTMWLFLLPAAMAVSSTGTVLGSVSGGESDRQGVDLVFKLGLFYACVPGVLLAAVFAAVSRPLAEFCVGGGTQRLSMTIGLLRCLAFTLPMTMVCQACISHLIVTGRRRCAVAAGILDGGVLLIPVSLLMGNIFGISGLWAARSASSLIMTVIVLMIMIITGTGSEPVTLKDTAGYSNDTSDAVSNAVYHIGKSVSDISEIIDLSEQVRSFLMEKGMELRICTLAALCLEELACNTLEWGYDHGKHTEIDIRTVYDNGRLTLRLRDSGKQFDPYLYVQQFVTTDGDPSKNIGLRIVSGIASEMRYACVADCNIVIVRIV